MVKLYHFLMENDLLTQEEKETLKMKSLEYFAKDLLQDDIQNILVSQEVIDTFLEIIGTIDIIYTALSYEEIKNISQSIDNPFCPNELINLLGHIKIKEKEIIDKLKDKADKTFTRKIEKGIYYYALYTALNNTAITLPTLSLVILNDNDKELHKDLKEAGFKLIKSFLLKDYNHLEKLSYKFLLIVKGLFGIFNKINSKEEGILISDKHPYIEHLNNEIDYLTIRINLRDIKERIREKIINHLETAYNRMNKDTQVSKTRKEIRREINKSLEEIMISYKNLLKEQETIKFFIPFRKKGKEGKFNRLSIKKEIDAIFITSLILMKEKVNEVYPIFKGGLAYSEYFLSDYNKLNTEMIKPYIIDFALDIAEGTLKKIEIIEKTKPPAEVFRGKRENKITANQINKLIIKPFAKPKIWNENENFLYAKIEKNNTIFTVKIDKERVFYLAGKKIENLKEYIGVPLLDYYNIFQIAVRELQEPVIYPSILLKWMGKSQTRNTKILNKVKTYMYITSSIILDIKQANIIKNGQKEIEEISNLSFYLYNIEKGIRGKNGQINRIKLIPTRHFKHIFLEDRPFTTILKSLVELEANNEKYAKLIGSHLIYVFRDNRKYLTNEDKYIERKVKTILEDCGLLPLSKKPSREKKRIEKALDKLMKIGLIEIWSWEKNAFIEEKIINEADLLNALIRIYPNKNFLNL